MLPFSRYAEVKDNYCVAYLGPELSYVVELVNARPLLEGKYPGIVIHICCRDEFASKLAKRERVIPVSLLKANKERLAYIRDMRHDGKRTPAQILLQECGISTYKTDVQSFN